MFTIVFILKTVSVISNRFLRGSEGGDKNAGTRCFNKTNVIRKAGVGGLLQITRSFVCFHSSSPYFINMYLNVIIPSVGRPDGVFPLDLCIHSISFSCLFHTN
jgi:hypothetical protein